jgi:hypothetical protein
MCKQTDCVCKSQKKLTPYLGLVNEPGKYFQSFSNPAMRITSEIVG